MTRTSLTRTVLLALALLSVTAGILVLPRVPAHAATNRYRIELSAWIPHASVTGPATLQGCPWGGTVLDQVRYNGNNHVGYDGEPSYAGPYKVRIIYDFDLTGTRIADVGVKTEYGLTTADQALCHLEHRVNSDGGVRPIDGGVELWMRSGNPLAIGGSAVPIDAALALRVVSADHLILTHRMDAFPSHGFRVIRNGVVLATAVDFDASCLAGRADTILKGLASSGATKTHQLDTRVANQQYFGPCGKTAPQTLQFPSPLYSPPAAQPVPQPGNAAPVASFTATRVSGSGNVVNVDASASKDPDGTIGSYSWSVDGRNVASGRIAALSLGAVSSAQITLTVRDAVGATGTLTRTVAVANRAPTLTSLLPASGSTSWTVTPELRAIGRDSDDDSLQYSYRLTGTGVDLSSGWVTGGWRVPEHRLDPGQSYTWTVVVRDPRGASVSQSAALVIASLPTAKRLVASSTGTGYWQVASDGTVFSYGSAPFHGSVPGLGLKVDNILGMARTPDDGGYWLVGSDGGVFSFGNAGFYGSMGGKPLNAPVVGMAPTPSGHGYWLVAADGGVFTFGDAGFYGSRGGQPLNDKVVAMAPTASGKGYWLAAADGGVFAYGDAAFYGSMGGQPLNDRVVDLQPTPQGTGYWLAAGDGGVFAFGGAQFYGSMGGKALNGRITSISPVPTGTGYWLNACDGGVFAFGSAPFLGSNPTYGCRGS